MKLSNRIEALVQLGLYLQSPNEAFEEVKQKAYQANNWFLPSFIDLSIKNIAELFLTKEVLEKLAQQYSIPTKNAAPKKVGIVMAGNIPLVGFHDLLCTFLTGHVAYCKLSSKDEVLMKHVVEKLIFFSNATEPTIVLAERLKGCDAYIATGSNNSSRYFDYYFGKYPHIIRRNRTSVAILTGNETPGDLENLADDVHQYFGLGCRNITKLYVPEGYDFVPLLDAFKKYAHFENHNKYKNNYDHNLALHILNNKYYMTNGSSVLLVENEALFSAISQLHYEFYTDVTSVEESLENNDSVQCIVGTKYTPFGQAQCPQLTMFADGVDTMKFLLNL